MIGDLRLLEQLGGVLDSTVGEETVRDLLITRMLKIRRKGLGVGTFELGGYAHHRHRG